MAAAVVYDGVNGKYEGTLFNGLKFWVAARVPIRSSIVDKIKARRALPPAFYPHQDTDALTGQRRQDCPFREACRHLDCRPCPERCACELRFLEVR